MGFLPRKLQIKYQQQRCLVNNYAFMSIADIVSLLAPFVTFPYLNKTLGGELFGWVITAQALVAYAGILVNYGFNTVSTRYIAIYKENKEKISEVISAIFLLRVLLWLIAFILYLSVVFIVKGYYEHFLLFVFTYGMTFDYLFFPQFYFLGLEKMKYISFVKVVIKLFVIGFTFVVVLTPTDYIKVPIIYTGAAIIASFICFYLIFIQDGIGWRWLPYSKIKFYLKDATPIFLTEFMSVIKNQSNYLLITSVLGPAHVVVYDVATKLQGILTRPMDLLTIVLFPKMSRSNNNKVFMKVGLFIASFSIIIYLFANVFLPQIVEIIMGQKGIDVMPVRIYLVSIIIMMCSKWIITSLFVARGKNLLVLKSMIFTTAFYLLCIGLLYIFNALHSLNAFVFIVVFTYLAELSYNLFYSRKLLNSSI